MNCESSHSLIVMLEQFMFVIHSLSDVSMFAYGF